MEQIKTGIVGLDSLLSGGLAKGSTTVLIGPVGTLKSYIGQQFIYTGLKEREPCIYISTVSDLKSVEDQVKLNFGWSLKPYVQKGLLKFVDYYTLREKERVDITEPLDAKIMTERMHQTTEKMSDGRIFHNFSPLFNFFDDNRTFLRMLHVINANARKTNATVLYLIDAGAQDKQIEENIKSLVDYVLTTSILRKRRRIRVTKALTKHGIEWHNLFLTDKGVEVEIIM
jgi:circadian clock protein KaiC